MDEKEIKESLEIKDLSQGPEVGQNNELFDELSKVPGFSKFLEEMITYDIKKYFFEPSKEMQDLLKGQFFRANYLLKEIRKAEKRLSK